MIKKKLGNFIDANGNVHVPKEGQIIAWRISLYVLIQQNDSVLFAKPNWSNKYELPGGGMEITESIFESLSRELREETGLNLASIENAPFYVNESNFYYYNESTESYNHSIGLFFKGSIMEGLSGKISDKNIIETSWISAGEILNYDIHPMHRQAIQVLFL